MPTFMDVHRMNDAITQADVAKAHQADLETQDQYVGYQGVGFSVHPGRTGCIYEVAEGS